MEIVYVVILILLALAPGLEARVAIPYGLGCGLHPLMVYVLSYIFSTLPTVPILYLLGWAEERLIHRIGFLERLYRWSIERVRGRVERIRRSKYIYLALLLYVAIPLPFTGVWTGSLIAYILGLDKIKSIASIALGNIIASSMVTLSVLGIIALVSLV